MHLVRHGEVDNPAGVIYGRIPGYRLSGDGRLMAKAAADFLAGRDVTVLRCSPLDRAVETAAPIAAELGLEAVTDDRLIEPANHFEGMRFGVGDGSLRQPRHWRYLWNPFRPVLGRALRARSRPGCWPRRPTRPGPRTATRRSASATSCPSGSTRLAAEGRRLWHDPRRRQCALGSVTSLTFAGGRVTGVSYAQPSGDRGSRVAGA